LTQGKAVYRHRIRKSSRGEKYKAIGEETQADSGARNRIISMRHRIHQSFKNRCHVELGSVNSSQCLEGLRLHVPRNKSAGVANLPVQRACNVGGVQLI
jgi:hypothetical protein